MPALARSTKQRNKSNVKLQERENLIT